MTTLVLNLVIMLLVVTLLFVQKRNLTKQESKFHLQIDDLWDSLSGKIAEADQLDRELRYAKHDLQERDENIAWWTDYCDSLSNSLQTVMLQKNNVLQRLDESEMLAEAYMSMYRDCVKMLDETTEHRNELYYELFGEKYRGDIGYQDDDLEFAYEAASDTMFSGVDDEDGEFDDGEAPW